MGIDYTVGVENIRLLMYLKDIKVKVKFLLQIGSVPNVSWLIQLQKPIVILKLLTNSNS